MTIPSWCEAFDGWVREHGTEDLDPLQRLRFREHSRSCERCEWSDPAEIDPADWPHLSDATLRDWHQAGLTSTERERAADAIARHLAACERCADRLSALDDTEWLATFGEIEDAGREFVAAAGAATRLSWVEGSHVGRAAWAVDAPGFGAAMWEITVMRTDGGVEVSLGRSHAESQQAWTSVVVTLSSDAGLIGRLELTPEVRRGTLDTAATPDRTWCLSPMVVAVSPAWGELVASATEPYLLAPVGVDSQGITVTLPWLEPITVAAFCERCAGVFSDARGRPVTIATAAGTAHALLSHEAGGELRLPDGSIVGTWSARVRGGVATLVLEPAHGVILRLADEEGVRVAEAGVAREAIEPPQATSDGDVRTARVVAFVLGSRRFSLGQSNGRRPTEVSQLGLVDLADAVATGVEMAIEWPDGHRLIVPGDALVAIEDPTSATAEYRLAARNDPPSDAPPAEPPPLHLCYRYADGPVRFDLLVDASTGAVYVDFAGEPW